VLTVDDMTDQRTDQRADQRVDELFTVGEVARIAGVTVRTLHHYDAIGLLSPGGRSASGYRLYDEADLDRLHAVLAYRELGFGLDEIASLLAGEVDPVGHLRRQHELVRTRIDQLTRLLGALETTMEAQMSGRRLTPEERFEVFGDHDPEQYADEARDRWGDTDAYRQSAQRTSRYTKDDWLRIKAEGEAVTQRFQDLFAAGAPADGPEAAQAVRAHREHISRWFYDLGPQMQRGLAEMYLADDRFRRNYDDRAPGLAQWVHDAILAETASA
jgi:MerR family transcriptional regulator, thiopeptide resistance regulator